MPCPACGSNSLWDDNLAWGCNRCDWFSTGHVRNAWSPHDHFPQDAEHAAAQVAQAAAEDAAAAREVEEAAAAQAGSCGDWRDP